MARKPVDVAARPSATAGPAAPGAPEGTGPEAARPRRRLGHALVVGARPKQWVKNLLVFAAPGAAGVLDQPTALWQTVGAFVCFCLAASGTYYLNDAADVDADRLHPTKRFRPIAAEEIPLGLARVIGVVGILGSVVAAALIDWHLAVVVASYVVLTTSYSHWLKHVAVVDVVAVAAGFVLRAIAGAAAVGVPVSNWFFIVTSFGSLFMVVGKRRAEVASLGPDAHTTRAALASYSHEYLVQLQTVCTGVVLVGYCLWAFEKADLSQSTVPWFEISIVPFVLAILRYALLVDTGHGGAPEDVVLGDRVLQVMGVVWMVVFVAGVYST